MNAHTSKKLTACLLTMTLITAANAQNQTTPKAGVSAPASAAPPFPQSVFRDKGRNPFMLGESFDRLNNPTTGMQTVSVTEADIARYRKTLVIQGVGGQSWALINGRQFFLNKPTLLDPTRPDFKNVEVMAVVIDDQHVVLRLLDGTNRPIDLKFSPAIENK